jgi:predicted phosphodiesterase
MKFDLGSDLHHCTWKHHINWLWEKSNDSSTLVIAGDLDNGPSGALAVVRNAAKFYERVIWVDGNHEHYSAHRPVLETEQLFMAKSNAMGNVVYLDGNSPLIVDGVAFIGANGWYDFKATEPEIGFDRAREEWLKMSNDPVNINFGTRAAFEMASLHALRLRALVTQLTSNPAVEKIVVVTHVPPLARFCGGSEYMLDRALNGAYCNTEMQTVLDTDTGKKIKAWVFGHTHARFDRVVDGVRYVTNSRGYKSGQMSLWKPVQIDTDDEFSY